VSDDSIQDRIRESLKAKDAVSLVDDFINEYCWDHDGGIQDRLNRISELCTELSIVSAMDLDGLDEDPIDKVRSIIEEQGGVFIEVDTEDARPATEVIAEIQKRILPLLKSDEGLGGNRRYSRLPRAHLWDERGRVVFTLDIEDEDFCKHLDGIIADMRTIIKIARVMYS